MEWPTHFSPPKNIQKTKKMTRTVLYFIERRSLLIICSFRHVYENNLQMAASTLSLINLLVATVRYNVARLFSRCFKMSSFLDSACFYSSCNLLRSCLEAFSWASVSRYLPIVTLLWNYSLSRRPLLYFNFQLTIFNVVIAKYMTNNYAFSVSFLSAWMSISSSLFCTLRGWRTVPIKFNNSLPSVFRIRMHWIRIRVPYFGWIGIGIQSGPDKEYRKIFYDKIVLKIYSFSMFFFSNTVKMISFFGTVLPCLDPDPNW